MPGLFIHPQITKHFALIAIKGHAVFPDLGYVCIEIQDKASQKKECAFYWLLFVQEEIIDIAQHFSCIDGLPFYFLIKVFHHQYSRAHQFGVEAQVGDEQLGAACQAGYAILVQRLLNGRH